MQQLHLGWLTDEAVRMKPYEAALRQFHPAIIGLISQFIDSVHPDDILAYLRKCMARGSDILFPPRTTSARFLPETKAKPRVRKARHSSAG
jgi:hypothetical protein